MRLGYGIKHLMAMSLSVDGLIKPSIDACPCTNSSRWCTSQTCKIEPLLNWVRSVNTFQHLLSNKRKTANLKITLYRMAAFVCVGRITASLGKHEKCQFGINSFLMPRHLNAKGRQQASPSCHLENWWQSQNRSSLKPVLLYMEYETLRNNLSQETSRNLKWTSAVGLSPITGYLTIGVKYRKTSLFFGCHRPCNVCWV